MIYDEVQNLRERIVSESEKYDVIVKEWIKQKPTYEMKTQRYNEKIIGLKQQIEDLIMERITDKSRSEFYNSMIEKREKEIEVLQNKNLRKS